MNYLSKFLHHGALFFSGSILGGQTGYYLAVLKQTIDKSRNENIGNMMLFYLNNKADTFKILGTYIGFIGVSVLLYNKNLCIYKMYK